MERPILQSLAASYACLIDLAERDTKNVEPCAVLLDTLADLGAAAELASQDSPPYYDLNEYLLYLAELPNQPQGKQRASNERVAAHFRQNVLGWVRQTAPNLDKNG